MLFCCFFFFQAEDGIRDLVRSRGLGDVYKRQPSHGALDRLTAPSRELLVRVPGREGRRPPRLDLGGHRHHLCLLYTSDAADERSSVDLGGRRIIKKQKTKNGDCLGHRSRQKLQGQTQHYTCTNTAHMIST